MHWWIQGVLGTRAPSQIDFFHFHAGFGKNLIKQERIQLNANHLLAESMGYIKFEGMQIFYFDLDVTFTLMYELDLINDL